MTILTALIVVAHFSGRRIPDHRAKLTIRTRLHHWDRPYLSVRSSPGRRAVRFVANFPEAWHVPGTTLRSNFGASMGVFVIFCFSKNRLAHFVSVSDVNVCSVPKIALLELFGAIYDP